MRLTCPNCGAQYEVPDEVIPTEGRDVQCSNCGNTWYHFHPDHLPREEAEKVAATPEPESDQEVPETTDPAEEIAATASIDDAATVADGAAQPDTPSIEDDDDDVETEVEELPADLPRRELDPAVSEILRQEAEHETRMRAGERGEALESQPDLGLDSGSAGGTPDRSAEDPLASLRAQTSDQNDLASGTDTRRGQLPDIEEINSTLRASGDMDSDIDETVDYDAVARRGGGFTRGFGLVVALVAILVLIYMNAGKISDSVPQAAPLMDAYVSKVDQGRVWLDSTISQYTPK